MHQETRIPRTIDAISPGLLAPFEFDNQMVVTIGAVSNQPTVTVAGDMDHAVLDGEDFLRIRVLRIANPRVEAFQVAAIEQSDGTIGRTDGSFTAGWLGRIAR